MKTLTLLLLLMATTGFSGDREWATTGKILTGLEGLRILSGGRTDVVGSVTGINRSRSEGRWVGNGRVREFPSTYTYEQQNNTEGGPQFEVETQERVIHTKKEVLPDGSFATIETIERRTIIRQVK